MALDTTVEAVGGLLKKYYESGDAKKQFFNDLVLLNRIKQRRNELVGAGNTVTVGLHVGRNASVAAAANGGATPTAQKQSVTQTTIPLRYIYAATQFTNPDIIASKKNAGAFANVMEMNMTQMLNDMRWDVNRQLFSDGSGILGFTTADSSTYTVAVEPYLWAPVSKYLGVENTRIEGYSTNWDSMLNGATVPAVVSACTSTTLTTKTDLLGTCVDGGVLGKFGALQVGGATTTAITQYEMMGLWGGIHNTDMIGSVAYKYDNGDAGNSAVTNYTSVEGQSHDWTGPGSLSNTNTFQGLATASYSWWQSKVWGNGGTARALSFTLLDNALGDLKVTQGSNVSAIYTTYQVQNKLIDLLRADRRYTGERMTIDGGMKVESYQGIPIIISEAAPRGTMFFVDESQLSFYIGKDFHFIDVNGGPLEKVAGYDAYNVTGAVYANLGFHNRQKHAKIIDLIET